MLKTTTWITEINKLLFLNLPISTTLGKANEISEKIYDLIMSEIGNKNEKKENRKCQQK